jgi:hypothetical protein
MNPTHPRLSEEQQRQRELNARRDLEQLVEVMMDAASDIWHDPRLSGRDRALACGRSAVLLATVDRQSKVLLDHPDAGVRADRLLDLHDMVEAAAILASGLKAPVAHRLRTAAATGANLTASQRRQQDENEVILEVTEPIRQRHPAEGAWQIAPRGAEEIKVRLEARGWGKLAEDTIARRLKELWSRRTPSLEK